MRILVNGIPKYLNDSLTMNPIKPLLNINSAYRSGGDSVGSGSDPTHAILLPMNIVDGQ